MVWESSSILAIVASRPALGLGHLGHLGHCLGPLTRERPQIYTSFFSPLKRLKELSNARDRDKRNLNKLVLQIDVLLITSNSNRKMLKI